MDAATTVDNGLAFQCRHDAARHPVKQNNAEVALYLLQRLGDCWLRFSKDLRGGRQASKGRDSVDQFHILGFHAMGLPVDFWQCQTVPKFG